MTIFKTVTSEGSKIIHIQKRFSTLPFTHQDLTGFLESCITLCTLAGEIPKMIPICLWGRFISKCWINLWCICWQLCEPQLMLAFEGLGLSWRRYILSHECLTCLSPLVSHHRVMWNYLVILTCHIIISHKVPLSPTFLECVRGNTF